MKKFELTFTQNQLPQLRGDLQLVREFLREEFKKAHNITVEYSQLEFEPDLFGREIKVTAWVQK